MVLKEISVVVSTYAVDRLNYVLDCVESLRTQTLSPLEIILVLDPYPFLREFYDSHVPNSVRIVVSDEYGLSNARNAGVINARGKIVAFIDDDAIANHTWLENLAKNYDDLNVVGAGGLAIPIWESGRPKWFPEELDWIVGCSYKGLPESKIAVRNPIGCNMSFRKDVFDKVGYFTPNIGRIGRNFMSGEETEFSTRVLKNLAGSIIVYDPSAVVYHRVLRNRVNQKYLVKRSFYTGISAAQWSAMDTYKFNPAKYLSVEYHYLDYLLRTSIPARLKRCYKSKSISQLLALLMSIYWVLTGYLIGKIMK